MSCVCWATVRCLFKACAKGAGLRAAGSAIVQAVLHVGSEAGLGGLRSLAGRRVLHQAVRAPPSSPRQAAGHPQLLQAHRLPLSLDYGTGDNGSEQPCPGQAPPQAVKDSGCRSPSLKVGATPGAV